jgi:hypothetical protein
VGRKAKLVLGGLALALCVAMGPVRARTTESAPTVGHQARTAAAHPASNGPNHIYLPFATKAFNPCASIPGESYITLAVDPPPTDRPAEEHPDLNLAIRGYEFTDAEKDLVDYGGDPDPTMPPQLPTTCSGCEPPFPHVYQVYDWDWPNNRRGDLLTDWPVTLVGMSTTPGATVHVPDSGYNIGLGYDALVLYASTERITLKYTRDDNVVEGYTVHIEGVCVEPSLLALYESWNAADREELPALRGGQALGRARGDEIKVAIRDTGSFMDPRSSRDWWWGWTASIFKVRPS